MRKIALLTIAKGNSKRLKKKNKLIYKGKPMFLWNIEKGLKISKNYYFNSDDDEMLSIASKLNLKIIKRDKKLTDHEIPSRLIFKSCFRTLPKDIEGFLHIQANSPNISISLIRTAFKIMKTTNIQELLTCDNNYKILGSLWGITRKKISKYNMNRKIHDKKIIKPDCFLLDTSIDIHNKKDLNKSLKQFRKKSI